MKPANTLTKFKNCPAGRKRGNLRTKTDKGWSMHSNPRPSKVTLMLAQQHIRWTEIHSHPHKGSNSISTHPPGDYTYPPPPLPEQVPQHSQIVVQQDPSTATALRQMAQLHQQLFKTSQTQMKALENIASASSFRSTVGCIPIYDGKDKDACTEWFQRCKEASYYMGYNFRSALLQRSSQDM